MGIDPSEAVLEDDDSGVDLAEGLVDSDKAGQEPAPIATITFAAAPASATPLEGLLQAGFLGRPAFWLPLVASELSTAAAEAPSELEFSTSGAGSEDGGGWSAAEVATEEEEDDDDGGDWWTAAEGGSVSGPRTT